MRIILTNPLPTEMDRKEWGMLAWLAAKERQEFINRASPPLKREYWLKRLVSAVYRHEGIRQKNKARKH